MQLSNNPSQSPETFCNFVEVHEAHRFERSFRPFRADLSIRKSSSFFPPLIAATSQRGLAPRPAQVSPGTTIFRRDFPSLQGASTASDDNASAADQDIHLLQLLLKLSPMLMKHFFNPLSQVHECFDGHP